MATLLIWMTLSMQWGQPPVASAGPMVWVEPSGQTEAPLLDRMTFEPCTLSVEYDTWEVTVESRIEASIRMPPRQ